MSSVSGSSELITQGPGVPWVCLVRGVAANCGMQARTARILRFSLPHDRDGRPCLPTRSRPTSPPSPPCERPVAAATRWPAAWAWRPPRSWPGRGSFGLEDGPAQLARWFATVTPAPSCRSECSLPGDPVPARIGCLRTRATRRRPTAPGCVSMTSPPRFPNATTRSPTAARSPAVPSTSDPSKGTLQGTQRRRTLLQ